MIVEERKKKSRRSRSRRRECSCGRGVSLRRKRRSLSLSLSLSLSPSFAPAPAPAFSCGERQIEKKVQGEAQSYLRKEVRPSLDNKVVCQLAIHRPAHHDSRNRKAAMMNRTSLQAIIEPAERGWLEHVLLYVGGNLFTVYTLYKLSKLTLETKGLIGKPVCI